MTMWGVKYRMLGITATNTPSEYVILIAFPLQQWLHKSASMLRYTKTACHPFNVCFLKFHVSKILYSVH